MTAGIIGFAIGAAIGAAVMSGMAVSGDLSRCEECPLRIQAMQMMIGGEDENEDN